MIGLRRRRRRLLLALGIWYQQSDSFVYFTRRHHIDSTTRAYLMFLQPLKNAVFVKHVRAVLGLNN